MFCAFLLVIGASKSGKQYAALLKGIAAGLILNFVLCLIQFVAIPVGRYPFWFLYSYSDGIAFSRELTTQTGLLGTRVFGFFNEPSELASSIAPWVLLMFGLRILPKRSDALTMFCRSRFALLAIICGTAAMIASRSGQLLAFVPGFVAIILAGMTSGRLRSGGAVTRLALVLMVLCLLAIGVADLSARLDPEAIRMASGGQGWSWASRATSLQMTMLHWLSPIDSGFVVGRGYQGVAWLLSTTGMNVWSGLGMLLLRFGLLGGVGLLVSCWWVCKSIHNSADKLLGFICAGNCLFAFTLTTPNEGLASLWIALGVFSSWHLIAGRRQSMPRVSGIVWRSGGRHASVVRE
jgi:hypothetical protein